LVKPGEPFSFFSSQISQKHYETNIAENRCHDGRGPPESESVFRFILNSYPDSFGGTEMTKS
jgi:hypothetical protein